MQLFSLFRFYHHYLLLLTVLFRLVRPQSFIAAISTYPQLSRFTSLIFNNPLYATTLLNTTRAQTILAPSNKAFDEYKLLTGSTFESLDPYTIQRILQYHTINATLKTTDLSTSVAAQRGLVLSTQLADKRFNNRGKWKDSNIRSPGQVVFITTGSTTGGSLGLAPRQGTSSATVSTGKGAAATMDLVDGTWEGGLFQIVDHFLTLPINCTDTMDIVGLKNMTTALTTTGEVDEWNSYEGVTCLVPEIGITSGTDADILDRLVDQHAIKSPQYTPALEDGQTFNSSANTTITVTIKEGSVWFNDARVVRSNIITNNGVIHVLDKAMSPNASSSAPTGTPTGTSASTPKPTTKSLGTPRYNRDITMLLSCLIPIFMGIFS